MLITDYFSAKGISMATKYTYIDLFAGCGGLSLGLYNAGWKGLFAIEKNSFAFSTIKHNLIDNNNHFKWPKWLPVTNLDINDIIKNYKNELEHISGSVTLVVGGPPCQGFSSAGRRNENDERNKLVDSYIEFIKIVKPELLFLENVQGFTVGFKKGSTTGKPYSLHVKEKLEQLGYNVYGKILDFAEYGIPQRRKRYILIGIRRNNANSFFGLLNENKRLFLQSKGLTETIPLEAAISDLFQKNGTIDSPDTLKFQAGIYSTPQSAYQKLLREGFEYTGNVADSHRFANHKKETVTIFQGVLENATKNKRIAGELRKKYGLKKRGIFLLDGDSVCATLTTHPDDYIHYSEPRILTVREYARIQSFPDWYKFKGKYTTGGDLRVKEAPRYSQVGNAIPPLFAEQVGLALKELLKNG
jgi:DNA (cytosine-5)-methyltransferase 1